MKNKDLFFLPKIHKKYIWDEEAVFCFTSDIDWASEDVLNEFIHIIPVNEFKFTFFVTHYSEIINDLYVNKIIERCIHPNFLPHSSHGNTFKEVIETCKNIAPESIGCRSHRAFDVTDVSHLLYNDFGIKYTSNTITTLQKNITPVLHESHLINLPVFFEDGSFLYNELGLSIKAFLEYFTCPGLKIISLHPMNMVFNTFSIKWMRNIKDSMSPHDYNHIDNASILKLKNTRNGIYNTALEIFDLVKKNNYKIMSMNEIYYETIKNN